MNVEQYLSTFFKGTKDPTLNAMKYFMEEFNHPEKDLKFIHIAGTNGKGSVAEMMNLGGQMVEQFEGERKLWKGFVRLCK